MTIKSFEVQGDIQTTVVNTPEISNPLGVAITSDRGTVLLGNQPEGPTGPGHFHIMKESASSVDLFFGDDYNYMLQPAVGGVQIKSADATLQSTYGIMGINSSGTVFITTDQSYTNSNGKPVVISGVTTPIEVNGTYYTMYRGSFSFYIYYDEALTLPVTGPGWAAWTSGGSALVYNNVKDVTITAGSSTISNPEIAGNVVINTENHSWNFGPGGGTLFPTLSVQRGDNPSGTINGQTLMFSDSEQEAIISTPAGVAGNVYSQRLVINPGQGYDYGEGGDIYLWAGRGGAGSGSGGDIKIRGGQGGANTLGGSGGAGGYIRMEAGDAASTGGSAGYVEITGGYGLVNGGDVTITSGNGGTTDGKVRISTINHNWDFGADGTLTAPGTVTTDSFLQSPYQPVAPRGLVNQGSGALTQITTAISTGLGAISVTVDPTGRFVYSTNVSDASVSQYSINQSTGALTQITTSIASGTFPYDVVVDPTGRFVYVVSSGDGTVNQYSINQSTGALTPITTAIAAGTQAISIAVDPTGRFVYVTNYDANTISQYSINQTTGALTQITTAIAAGNAPRDVAVDPTGRFVYAVSSADYTVRQYSINQLTGALTAITTISTGLAPYGIAVDPTGRFVYVANYSSGTINQYSINQVTGTLTEITTEIFSGSQAFSIAVDPTGKFVYVSNQDDNTVSQYSINQVTGKLTQITVAIASGTMSADVAVDPTGRFVYVTNYSDSTISQYRINNFSAGSATIPIITVGSDTWTFGTDGSLTLPDNGSIIGDAAVATISSTASRIGYLGMPQNSKSANYGLLIGDMGKHVYVTATSIVTIPTYTVIDFPIGTTIAIIAGSGATVSIAITTDTMYLGGAGTTGTRTLAPFGMATLVKVTQSTWFISGTGLT